ncbi:hypothetical protein GO491_09815 [Flavobacteriaceae bacterium Ap0902]|nr:hypothetical protein [Flavobacteriaceae bacterium Ap0902]
MFILISIIILFFPIIVFLIFRIRKFKIPYEIKEKYRYYNIGYKEVGYSGFSSYGGIKMSVRLYVLDNGFVIYPKNKFVAAVASYMLPFKFELNQEKYTYLKENSIKIFSKGSIRNYELTLIFNSKEDFENCVSHLLYKKSTL